MHQLIQIPFQNFFSILCTNRSPSPFDFHSSETSADPHHDTDTQHQTKPIHTHTQTHHDTPADTPPRSHAPSALPYSQPYHRTTAPHSQLYSQPHHRTTVPPYRTLNCTPNRTTVQPYHRTALSTVLPTAPPYNRTTVPHSQLYSQPHHRTTVPLHRTLNCTPNCTPNRTTAPPHRTPRHTLTPPRPHPHHTIPLPHSHTIPTPAGRFDAAPTPSRRRTGAAPDATGARVAAGPRRRRRRRWRDAGLMPSPRLQYPPVGRVVVRPKAGQRTGGMSQLHAQALAICHTLRTAHRIPRRPAGPTLVGPGRRVPLSPASPASPDA